MPYFMVSAAHKSSGKTTVTIGLCAALKKRNLKVQPFKKGPDYIDPMWHRLATENNSYNLDFHTMGKDELRNTFRQYAHKADISIIEGNKGLFDGLDIEGRNSNAALARLLKAPVILVIDAQGMTRGIAPLILGYQAFDSRVNIAGVILNKLGGKRHEGKLRAVIEHYTDVPVIGAVHKDPLLEIKEQHLGLTPSIASQDSKDKISRIADLIASQIDLEKVIEIAHTAPAIKNIPQLKVVSNKTKSIRLGIARDEAFGFYYPDDLSALEEAGAELVNIDTLKDKSLPDVDGLFIGGGFPESHMSALSANSSLRASIATAIKNGLPTYAECGGLMYLTRSIEWNKTSYPMVGAIPADTLMCEKPQGRGYVRLQETGLMPWAYSENQETHLTFCAHEFHYSKLTNISNEIKFAYKVLRGTGITGENDGIVYKNLLASYAHLRDVKHNRWAQRFVDFVIAQKEKNFSTNNIAVEKRAAE